MEQKHFDNKDIVTSKDASYVKKWGKILEKGKMDWQHYGKLVAGDVDSQNLQGKEKADADLALFHDHVQQAERISATWYFEKIQAIRQKEADDYRIAKLENTQHELIQFVKELMIVIEKSDNPNQNEEYYTKLNTIYICYNNYICFDLCIY